MEHGVHAEAIGGEGGVSGDGAEDELGKMAEPRKRISYLQICRQFSRLRKHSICPLKHCPITPYTVGNLYSFT